MRLLLRLTATLVLYQVTGLTQCVNAFHTVHHGHGATSYQNVQVENHGSLPVPSDDLGIRDEQISRLAHHEEIHEIPSAHVDSIDEKDQYLHSYILLQEDPREDSSPVAAAPENDEHLQQYIALEQIHHEVPSTEDNHQNIHYITLEQVSYSGNELQHVELQDASHLQYYDNNFEHDQEYEYH